MLVSIDPVPYDHESHSKWNAVVEATETETTLLSKVVKIHQSAWLLERDLGIYAAAACIAKARYYSLDVKVRFLTEDES